MYMCMDVKSANILPTNSNHEITDNGSNFNVKNVSFKVNDVLILSFLTFPLIRTTMLIRCFTYTS